VGAIPGRHPVERKERARCARQDGPSFGVGRAWRSPSSGPRRTSPDWCDARDTRRAHREGSDDGGGDGQEPSGRQGARTLLRFVRCLIWWPPAAGVRSGGESHYPRWTEDDRRSAGRQSASRPPSSSPPRCARCEAACQSQHGQHPRPEGRPGEWHGGAAPALCHVGRASRRGGSGRAGGNAGRRGTPYQAGGTQAERQDEKRQERPDHGNTTHRQAHVGERIPASTARVVALGSRRVLPTPPCAPKLCRLCGDPR
jgi:hypothetical protein